MTLYIGPIVEGQTEQGCVERLLHRVWHELLSQAERLQVVPPFRGRRDQLVHPNGLVLTDTVSKAMVKLRSASKRDLDSRRLVLLLLDAEDDCPKDVAPRLLATARSALPEDVSVSCVLAKKMLENWMVAGASTLAGVNGLPAVLPPRDQCEDRNGAKWLNDRFRSQNPTRKYSKTIDAELLVHAMALQECRDNAPSFDKLCRELEVWLAPPPDEAGPPDATDSPADENESDSTA